jgi:hypothetical protein
MKVEKLKQNANNKGKRVSALKKPKVLKGASGEVSMDGENTASC